MKKALPFLAAALLVLAVSSGTVGANALLTGKDVKNGSLTGADIKAGSLAASVLSGAAQDASVELRAREAIKRRPAAPAIRARADRTAPPAACN